MKAEIVAEMPVSTRTVNAVKEVAKPTTAAQKAVQKRMLPALMNPVLESYRTADGSIATGAHNRDRPEANFYMHPVHDSPKGTPVLYQAADNLPWYEYAGSGGPVSDRVIFKGFRAGERLGMVMRTVNVPHNAGSPGVQLKQVWACMLNEKREKMTAVEYEATKMYWVLLWSAVPGCLQENATYPEGILMCELQYNLGISKEVQQLKEIKKALEIDPTKKEQDIRDKCRSTGGARRRWSLSRDVRRSKAQQSTDCLLYTSPSPRDLSTSRMPSSA